MLNEIFKIGIFIWEAFLHVWPYILITIPLAVIVNVSGISRFIKKAFMAKPLVAIFLSTIVGAFSPFCSCGVIPIISALLIGGVPLAPVMSFWLASPSMDPEIFFLSVSQLGLNLAVWRMVGTFIISLGGGYITYALVKSKWIGSEILRIEKRYTDRNIFKNPVKVLKSMLNPEPLITAVSSGSCSCTEKEKFRGKESLSREDPCSSKSSIGNPVSAKSSYSSQNKEKTDMKKRILLEIRKSTLMILKFMLLAYFLEALISFYLPTELISSLLGNNNKFAITVSAFIGVPLYTTNITALGLVGGLLNQGMSPAAALAFLIGGATTTVPAMAAVYGLVKKRVFILYVGFALGGALLAGYLYQFFIIVN